ncbi:uncharacterized protein BYT42DRAFT_518041 [Radiomyces spectabilis]|uniref:uncharacterized protein n=1 Tax=Radiomyces spectabilis TaxID=64574 RepID=UPI00221E56AD|nr:uncharacterized protein BYT42DRAFT_518041 [Radiomyces spectabilis]KAI8374388.1 hypothetical protein BYT42DRAFT_518041 [Radiomyces spectabilis]
MGTTAMDLDSSLDDIIKKKKEQKHKPKPAAASQRNQAPFGRRNTANTNNVRGRLAVSNRSKVIGKSTQRNPPSRVVPSRPLTTAGFGKVNRGVPKADPANIVITKAVSRSPAGPKAGTAAIGRFEGRLGKPSQSAPRARARPGFETTTPPARPVYEPVPSEPASQQRFTIRGIAHTTSPGLSIRGEAGPATVLISNLDPGANAEDVKTACQQFGPVNHVELLMDRYGRSYGEAEVEFSNKASALQCITKLDNEIADGRVLRAILRNKPAGVSSGSSAGGFATQSVRSMVAPVRSGFGTASSGKMYADHVIPTGPAAGSYDQSHHYDAYSRSGSSSSSRRY